VPWCERCDRFLNPNTVQADGTCPSCGRPVEPVDDHAAADGTEGSDEEVRAPWHFWVMVAGVVAYLGWRLVQFVLWGIDNWL
jgi:hypothetical protein